MYIFVCISKYSGKSVIEDLAVSFVCISNNLAGASKRILLVLVMFSSKAFILSELIFIFLIPFEFIFGYDVRKCFSFFLLHMVDQFSQHHLLKS